MLFYYIMNTMNIEKPWGQNFYPENTHFVSSEVNKTFDEVLKMTNEDFKQWIIDVRKKVAEIWDTYDIPPVNGYSEPEIIKQFNQLQVHFEKGYSLLECKDELTGMLCVRNTHNRLGNACNSWFSNMLKTRIDYGGKEPKSIYDFFKEDALLEKYMPYGYRHFKRDSFYAYSQCVLEGTYLPNAKKKVNNGVEFIKLFEEGTERLEIAGRENYDYWISEKDADVEYSGYDEKLMNKKWCQLTFNELESIKHLIPEYALSNIKKRHPDSVFIIRMFQKGQKMFPVGLKSFRLSFVQGAVNYPPVMAKYIWERYTQEFKKDETVYVWDPSCGWGGRILGSMCASSDRKLMYLGTDPNPDNWTSPPNEIIQNDDGGECGRTKGWSKYDDLAYFVNTKTFKKQSTGAFGDYFDTKLNEWKVWQLGSEVVQHDKEFQTYKGKVSVVFTSPPYFSREIYSEDENQSCHKFAQYEDWKTGFLFETLKTAYEWLRPGGYIVWNIADVPLGNKGEVLPLQKDSIEFMKSFGMEHVETIAMCLAQMPGSNRTKKDARGDIVSTNRNEIKLDGKLFRYEPIIVFRKPK